MIIETILTSRDPAGRINFAPMGVEWAEDRIVAKPYRETTTFRNLLATGEAVVNLTDDVLVFARAALGTAEFPADPAAVVQGVVLRDACSWREVRVVQAETDAPRARFTCEVVHRGTRREFLGFNRARHAVLEATILATRTRLLPIEEILRELDRLQVIVDKTAGSREVEAMDFVGTFIRREADALRGAA
jgi:uncharacterized protein